MPTTPRSGSDQRDARLPTYILAGGRSRRFGADKARAKIDGLPLIVQVADLLKPFARSVTVVAAEPGVYDDLALVTIGDVVKGKGPIGGLLTAIYHHAGDGWILLSACDWLGIRPEWIRRLLESRSDAVDAVVYRTDRFEPLLGLYHSRVRATVVDHIARSRLQMQELLAGLETRAIPAPDGWADATNLNRPIVASSQNKHRTPRKMRLHDRPTKIARHQSAPAQPSPKRSLRYSDRKTED